MTKQQLLVKRAYLTRVLATLVNGDGYGHAADFTIEDDINMTLKELVEIQQLLEEMSDVTPLPTVDVVIVDMWTYLIASIPDFPIPTIDKQVGDLTRSIYGDKTPITLEELASRLIIGQ